MKGGKLSSSDFKGLLDASYDPSIKKVGGFNLDKPLSSSTSKVYRNPETGQVVVAHRGTEGISDWGNNAIYALGGKQAYKLTPRYKEAEKVQKRAEKKYGASNVTTIGHSQGGLQSELLGGKSKEIITLNKATLPFESNKNKNQYDIRSDRDVVSGLNPFAKKSKKDISIKAKSYNPLTEHSGDVLNRLDKKRMIGQGPKKAQPKEDDEEVYGSFGRDDGILVPGRYIPPDEQEIRGKIHFMYDGNPATYFRIRELKNQLFEMLVREGLKGKGDYDDFMTNFYPEPVTPVKEKPKLKAKQETPQSAKSDSSRRSSFDGPQFDMEGEFSGTGIMRRNGRKGVYMKGFGRMRGGVVVTPPPSPPPSPPPPPPPSPPPSPLRPMGFLNLEDEVQRDPIQNSQKERIRDYYGWIMREIPLIERISINSAISMPIRQIAMGYIGINDETGIRRSLDTAIQLLQQYPTYRIASEVEDYMANTMGGLFSPIPTPFVAIEDWNGGYFREYIDE